MIKDQWEFNVFGIYNYHHPGKLKIFYDWLLQNHQLVEGDIIEAGVFKGKTLLSTSLLLKNIQSDKQVYGFDSFSGFPPIYHENDRLEKFQDLHQDGLITDDHLARHNKLKRYRSVLKQTEIDVKNISSSEEFVVSAYDTIKLKSEFLELDNMQLIKGIFAETMREDAMQSVRFCAGILDCDLFESYNVALEFIWNRLSIGGMLFLDEYYSLKFPGARIACDAFFQNKADKPQMASGLDDDFERWFVIKTAD